MSKNKAETTVRCSRTRYYSDDREEFFVDDDSGESVWHLPDGAAVKDGAAGRSFTRYRSDDGEEFFVDDYSGESVWHLPDGAAVVDGQVL